MRYVCSICGYIYDEEQEKQAFADLPESWTCPLCRAPKALFAAEKQEKSQQIIEKAAAVEEDMTKLSYGELAALCSGLAQGCLKQYKNEEAELFLQIADYFSALAPNEENSNIDHLQALFQEDLDVRYPNVRAAATEQKDRGSLRACTWGEKVTNILNSLLVRYQKEGGEFLKDTAIWVCSVCGFMFVGNEPPELCPVCKVPVWKFNKVEEGK